jgi:hypothetical protein
MDKPKEELTRNGVEQLLLGKIKSSIESSTTPADLECLSRALERVGRRP